MIPYIGVSPLIDTYALSFVLLVVLALSFKPRNDSGIFPLWVTAEVKGLAILLILLGHTGYFLIENHDFLRPLSNYSGVGVDLFLVVSGYGLAISALSRPLGVLDFYKRRFFKVFVPVFLTVLFFTIADAIFLSRFYPLGLTIKNLFGFFPSADLYRDIDSPLWFMTPLFVYYLLFPFVCRPRWPWLAPLFFILLAYVVTRPGYLNVLHITNGVYGLYTLHSFGFGVGVLFGSLVFAYGSSFKAWIDRSILVYPRVFSVLRVFLIAVCLAGIAHTSVYTHVGEGWRAEQFTSVAASCFILFVMTLKPFRLQFLSLLGAASFFVYLVHWPVMYRYDLLFERVPSLVAFSAYCLLLVLLPFTYQKVKSLF